MLGCGHSVAEKKCFEEITLEIINCTNTDIGFSAFNSNGAIIG